MNIGIIGCGNMGSGMARTLRKKKCSVFCYDKSPQALNGLEQVGCTKVASANDFVLIKFKTSRTLYAEERTYLTCARVPGRSLVFVAVIFNELLVLDLRGI